MSIVGSNALAGASGQSTGGGGGGGGFQIDRSLRFNSGDSPSLSKSFGSAGDRKKWTWSGWFKIGSESQPGRFFSAGADATNRTNIFYYPRSNNLGIGFFSNVGGSLVGQAGTTALLADHSAWYHLVFAFDAANSTTADRLKIYINGVEQVISYSVNVSNIDHLVNSNIAHYVGRGADGYSFDGYLAEVYFIDGQALAATDFGAPDANNNWNPIAFSGSYGSNGFYLKFADNSSNAALGTDSSGNSNTWTVTSLTAAVTSANTSQTWSSSSTGYHSGAGSAFDGNLTTSSFATGGANANAYVDITAINASKVEVYISAYGSASAGGYWYARQTNGTEHRYTITSSGTSLGWVTVYDGTQIQINRLGGARDSDGDAGSAQYAWKVDGKILVDSGTTGFDPSEIDSLLDTPTNYDDGTNVGGNYATWNALTGNTTLSNGNLDSTGKSGYNQCLSTIGMSSGKYYCEITVTDDTGYTGIGIATKAADGSFLGSTSNGYLYYSSNGNKRTSGTNASYGDSYTTGDIIGIAFDADGGNLYFYKNEAIQNSGTAAFTGLTSGPYFFAVDQYNTSNVIAGNFGQRPFSISSVPTGYKSLCTQNFGPPAIADGSTAFDTKLWSGSSSSQTITYPFALDFAWIKSRNQGYHHILLDTVRGDDNVLLSDQVNDESSIYTFAGGQFSGNDLILPVKQNVNQGSNTYVGWAWDAGDLVTNSAYNQSQTWSSGMKTTTAATTTYSTTGRTTSFPDSLEATFPFDADLTNYLYSQTGVQGTWLYIEFGTALTNVTSIEFNTEYSCPGGVIKLNGTDVAVDQSNIGGGFVTVSVTGTIPSSLTEIAIQGYSGSARLKWVKINSKYLLDPGAVPAGSISSGVPSIASTVRANPSAGFSIVTYTGNNTNSTVAHGLNATPSLVIVKSRSVDSLTGWMTRHSSLSSTYNLALNLADAAWNPAVNGYVGDLTSSTTFSLVNGSTNGNNVNQNNVTYLALCWAAVEGYSAFGSYTGNDSSDGPFVYTGFRPKFILQKRTDTSGASWNIVDTERSSFNVAGDPLYPDSSALEGTIDLFDILSNGFKVRTTNAGQNALNGTFIWAAFAEHPFKTARAR